MHPVEEHYLDITRRRFFGVAAQSIGAGLGSLALSSLLRAGENTPVGVGHGGSTPHSPAPVLLGPHFPARAKRVIYMHMEGAPSQIDLWDYKPGPRHRCNQDLPGAVRQGQRLTGMNSGQARLPVAPKI